MVNIVQTTVESKTLAAGTHKYGFGGEVPASELWTGDELAALLGVTQGFAQNTNEPYLKWFVDGKVILKSKKPFRHSISWNHLNEKGLVYGGKIIQDKYGNWYKVRLMKGALTDPSPSSASDQGAKYSEWNKLMLPIHEQAKNKNWNYPNNVEPEIPSDWNIEYTDKDLNINLYTPRTQWCQEVRAEDPSKRIDRGHAGISHCGGQSVSVSSSSYGWSPVLELIEKPINILQEVTQHLSAEVFLSEGLNKIEGWNELHEHNGEIICLTDFFGDDVEVLVYEEEPDEDNPLQLEFEANYSPIDEAGDNLELLVPEDLEELQVEGMTNQPVYAVSKEMDKSILYNMSDPYIMGNGKVKISVSQDKLNWTNEILVKDISLDWIDALPNKLFIKLSFENCKHCFVGYLSILDWEMFADEPIVQNDITSVVQNFYSGAYDIPNHKIEASFNDGVNWVTVYENKINQIAASAIQTGKLRLRITGTKNQTLYPFSFSWTEK